MRANLLLFALLAAKCLLAADFALVRLSVPAPASGPPLVTVHAGGAFPPQQAVLDANHWHIYAQLADAKASEFRVTRVGWKAGEFKIDLFFHPDFLHGHNPKEFTYKIVFDGPPQLSIPSPKANTSKHQNPLFSFAAAKGKDDADFYLFGSFTAGFSTKPLYVIDAKLNWLYELRTSGWFAGVKSSFSSNTSATTPVDRTQVDPDSVTGSLLMSKTVAFRYADTRETSELDPKSYKTHRLEALTFDLRPVGGEFSRKYPASDLVTGGFATLELSPWQPSHSLWLAFYPSAGYEIGSNLNKPHVLFKNPVDLSAWNTIGRAAFSARGELYGVKAKPSAGDIYRFTLDVNYQPRIPFTQEPFVDSEYIGGKRTSVVRLGTKTRHELESSLNYNFTKYAALTIKYRWGSLPPLFEFVDHQTTIGLTLKAKQNH